MKKKKKVRQKHSEKKTCWGLYEKKKTEAENMKEREMENPKVGRKGRLSLEDGATETKEREKKERLAD